MPHHAFACQLGAAALCLATFTASAVVAQETPAAPAAKRTAVAERHPLDRVVVIGAGITGGFGARMVAEAGGERREADFDLGMVMDYIIDDDVSVVTVMTDYFYFKNPDRRARKQTFDSRKQGPTTIVALDLLFWFAHQDISATGDPDELLKARLVELDRGLSYLEGYNDKVNIIIGDIPDMGAAVGSRIALLSPQVMPLKQNLPAINQHIRDWATLRGNTYVVPLSEFYAQAHAGQDVSVGPETWSSDIQLLRDDKIHPTPEGLAAIGQLIGATMLDKIEGVEPSNMILISPVIRAKMLEHVFATAPVAPRGPAPAIGTGADDEDEKTTSESGEQGDG